MKRLVGLTGSLCFSLTLTACGGSDDTQPPLFEQRPECEGDPVAALSGQHQQIISALAVAEPEDGIDLDGDGEVDNVLGNIASLARGALEDAFKDASILIPLEFFDYPTVGADECVKFAMYVGKWQLDRDGDDDDTAKRDADCNDHDAAINRDAAEVPGNFKDDNCDGLADETVEEVDDGNGGVMNVVVPSDNTDDMDGDGVTIADGDCDDTNDQVKPGLDEVCDDGLDNDCDGNADYQNDGDGGNLCTPYDPATPRTIPLDTLAFNGDGTPKIAFTAGTVFDDGGTLRLEAGPSVFQLGIPIIGAATLELRVTGATITGTVEETSTGMAIKDALLAGVIDSNTADKITGLDVEQIGLTEEDTLLDATYANVLGLLLALPKKGGDGMWSECQTPDVDVDRDGLEAFCDSDMTDEFVRVDVCIDGDGTEVFDEVDADGKVITQCTEAVDDDGNLRFVDGISVAIEFDTVPAMLPSELPAE